MIKLKTLNVYDNVGVTIKCVPLSLSQPPPQIYDKQLDEREHSIDEWKGRPTFGALCM